ncbi:MAG: methyltransferase [Burkholderiales bacterium]
MTAVGRACTDMPCANTAQGDPLALVLRSLAASGYRFVTTTPLTHQRVLAGRTTQISTSLRDIFGWNRPFTASALQPGMLVTMRHAGIVLACADLPGTQLLRSAVRVASLDDDLFVHSAYPTDASDAVFFGPDTYRFARFIRQVLTTAVACTGGRHHRHMPTRILDIGCGSGAGGVVAARWHDNMGLTATLTLNDINPLALHYTALNVQLAGMTPVLVPGDALHNLNGEFDLIVCNPPYLDDTRQRTYRHGGTRLGRDLSVRLAQRALAHLAPGGRLLLYTGVAIERGIDPLRAELLELLAPAGCSGSYAEIDPDVFGEELDRPVYAQTDRIAAVGFEALRSATPSCHLIGA